MDCKAKKYLHIYDWNYWWGYYRCCKDLEPFHAWSLPQYIGSEYFSTGDDDAEYRITLPFDADADRYLGNAEYVMQKKNVTVLFCEDTDMPEDE